MEGTNGKWHLTLFIENGRIRDWEDYPLMTGLRTIAQSHDGDFRLTANGNLILGNVSEENRPRIEQLVQSYKLSDGHAFPLCGGMPMACVSLPTCGCDGRIGAVSALADHETRRAAGRGPGWPTTRSWSA